MKPFTAWLAMDGSVPDGDAVFHYHESAERWSVNDKPQRVLIVADTAENRKKLGMEAECRS